MDSICTYVMMTVETLSDFVQQARERLTAICQGKPCIIRPEDCSIKEVSLDDFPPDADRSKAEIFIYWVRLCSIIGKVAKYLAESSWSVRISQPTRPGIELVAWVNSLPPHMRLPIDGERTTNFNRNVHQLYLPYLAVIIVLHLKRSDESLPIASSTAILAATCIARIYKDMLIRGGTRFLMPISCWYCATAFMTLSYASKRADLRPLVEEELDVLYATIKELQKMWGTASIFEQGFQRLRSNLRSREADPPRADTNADANPGIQPVQSTEGITEESEMNWSDRFPFATPETSPLARVLFGEQNGVLDLFTDLSDDFMGLAYPELLQSFDMVDPSIGL